jgi:hypothetical protein
LLEKRISDLQKAVEDVNNRMKALEQELRTEAEKALSGHSLLVPEIDNHFNEEEDEGNQMFVTEEYHKTEIDAAEGTQENQVSDTQQRRTDKETIDFQISIWHNLNDTC